ncbi:SdiA-regulated domain-containing protein [Pedobacter sp. ASV28]|uniref:SdiA-regulated domain-containing protein n=1 Tax=Pedobacter sp. ASV28 TaxID=2795123 RepID=UPI001E562388|nr:SdiA-regulated domain-containing protein [Pedobacter sp. ASV28]
MLKKYIPFIGVICLSCAFTILSCAQEKGKKDTSPRGYDLAGPVKYNMPDILQEISGIAFLNGDPHTVFAEQDEEGKVFVLTLGAKKYKATKFAKNGDYEDIAILKDRVIVLKSNGDLYAFPLSETQKELAANVMETKSILPKGEYEGMYANSNTGLLYVICKECKQDKKGKITSGFILAMQSNGSFKLNGNFSVDVSALEKLTGRKKGTFHPSALALNALTKEWYIISAINKVLVVTDANWKVKNAYHLSSNVFNQPEGIAFDKYHNLYISNEGSDTQYGNILKFDYKKPKK